MARGHVKCDVCGQVLGKAGVTSHLRSRHPEIFEAFNADKPAYYAAHACNQDGTPITSTPTVSEKASASTPNETSTIIDTPTPPNMVESTQAGEAATPEKSFRDPKPKSKRKGGLAGLFGYTD